MATDDPTAPDRAQPLNLTRITVEVEVIHDDLDTAMLADVAWTAATAALRMFDCRIEGGHSSAAPILGGDAQ
jgi:hypothetical protein